MKCYPWNSTKQNIPDTPCICAWYSLIEQNIMDAKPLSSTVDNVGLHAYFFLASLQHKEASTEKKGCKAEIWDPKI